MDASDHCRVPYTHEDNYLRSQQCVGGLPSGKLMGQARLTDSKVETEEAQDYAQSLATKNWLHTYKQLNGQPHTPRVSPILSTLHGQGRLRHAFTKLQMHTQSFRIPSHTPSPSCSTRTTRILIPYLRILWRLPNPPPRGSTRPLA